jgi:hypothetical protein
MAFALNYSAPYGQFHFQNGLLTVRLNDELIVDLALVQQLETQRREILGGYQVAQLLVVPAANLLLEAQALDWLSDSSSMAGVHHRAIVVPLRTKVWRDVLVPRPMSSVRVFSRLRPAERWLEPHCQTSPAPLNHSTTKRAAEPEALSDALNTYVPEGIPEMLTWPSDPTVS